MMTKLAIFFCLALLIGEAAVGRVARGVDHSQVAVGNRSYNQNVNVNRNANVNRNVNVNQNVNVNRNVDVHGYGYRGPVVVEDNSWNYGAFAAGAATAAVAGAAIHAATEPHAAVVAAPAVGTVVTALPGSCATVAAGGAMVYNCGGGYYRPFYQGTTLVYQVVTYP
jgi:hypothetical protein